MFFKPTRTTNCFNLENHSSLCHASHVNKVTRVWLMTGVILVLALVLAAWLGRPAYRRYKEQRSLARAHSALQAGDYRNAVLALRQTLAANSGNREATRLMGDLAVEAQSPVALAWRRRGVELAPTLDNKILLVSAAMRVEKPPYPIAAQTLEELHATGADTNIAYHLVASQLAIRLNHAADAATHLEFLIRYDPTNRLHQLNLAALQLRSTNAATAARAKQELTALTSDLALGEHALRSLITDAMMDRRYDKADELSRLLLALPQPRFEDRLARLTVLHEAHSKQVAPWLAEVKAAAGTNAMRIAATVGWLNGHGQSKDALSWIGSLPPAVRATPPLPVAEVDCFVTLRDWSGLETRLSEQRWDDQEFVRLALLARALREQGRRELATAQWRRATAAAGARVEGLTVLSQLASSWSWNEEAEEVLWTIVRRAPWADWAWSSLVRNRLAVRDAAGL